MKSDFHVFTVKVNENGGFWPPEDAFWGPLGAPLALTICMNRNGLSTRIDMRMKKFHEIL